MKQSMKKLQNIALNLIAEQENLKDIEISGWVADRVPSTGMNIYKFSAVNKNKPNGPIYSIVVDEQGRVVNLKTLTKKAKVDFFPPFSRSSTEDPNPPVKLTSFSHRDIYSVPVTISPDVNNLYLSPGQIFTEDIHVIIPAGSASLVDVYFLADTTYSMHDTIEAVKSGAITIMNNLQALYPNMAFGVGNYKDFMDDNPYCFEHQQSCNTDVSLALTAINSWDHQQGGDIPEGQLYALDRVATDAGIWRSGAQKFVVWFGDQPGHDPICAGLPGVTTPITEAIVKSHLVTAGIKVLAINVGSNYSGLDGEPNPISTSYPCPPNGSAGQGTRIATATGGSYSDNVNSGTICNAIISAITGALNSFDNVHLAASGSTEPFVTAITPAAGHGPVSVSEEHDYVFQVTFTGPPCGDNNQIFSGTIDVIADGTKVAEKKVRLNVSACSQWSYGVKFLCGYVKEKSPQVVPLTPSATLRPGIYATEVNILNYHEDSVTVRKFVYPLIRRAEAIGREPKYVGHEFKDIITLPGHSATFDDCIRLNEIMEESSTGDEPLSMGFLEIVSPVELNVTAVYTANDLRGISVDIEVVQIEGKRIQDI